MPVSRQPIPGSERAAPQGRSAGAADPNERVEVSIYLRDDAPAGTTTREQCATERSRRLAPAISDLTQFARQHGLDVTKTDPARRLVKLSGTVSKLESAFGTKLECYEHQGCRFRARRGPLSVPAHLSDKIEAVLGLDSRPVATPKIAFPLAPAQAVSHLPNEIAALYAFPKTPGMGKGQCIAIIELGGGYTDADTRQAFAAMNLPVPSVVAVSVSGGSNAPGQDSGADGEVALDIQVAGGAAPGAKIAVYFAPNTDQGFVDAISKAVHDKDNAPSVLSISWGSAEPSWTQQAVASMNSAFSDAASLGVTVCAASGDSLAGDGVSDGKAHVDFPASSPFVVGCGGTKITATAGTLSGETVWNSNGGGTGGGISELFALPDYQSDAKVPVSVSTKKPGRGVPDVAADADPNTGYQVVVAGNAEAIGGTSASAPLWAGLFALLNESRGTPLGQPHSALYRDPAGFRDITQGDNRSGSIGYSATSGWDACTGLGSPKGTALVKALGSKASA
jgi:kumamolisin